MHSPMLRPLTNPNCWQEMSLIRSYLCQSISQYLSDDLKLEIFQCYETEIFNDLYTRNLGDQNHHVWVMIGKDPTLIKELQDCIIHIITQNIPLSLVKKRKDPTLIKELQDCIIHVITRNIPLSLVKKKTSKSIRPHHRSC